MIKFSVGIPAYKGQFFKKCIESVLNQSYSNLELIIVNDCSPQDLSSIVNQFEDERIKYFDNKKNIGSEKVVKNWNKCLEHATGDYFVLMGDDDMLAVDYLSEFVKLIKKYPELDVFHCRTMVIDENENPIKLTSSWPEFETLYDNIWHRLTGRRIQYISDFVYRTDHLKLHGGFFDLPLAWGSDDITAYRACGKKGIAHINKVLFKYRSNSYSITSTGDFDLKLISIIQYFNWLNMIFDEIKPVNKIELINYNYLKKNILQLRKSSQRQIIVTSLDANLFKDTFSLLINKNRLNIKLWQIIYYSSVVIINKFKKKFY
ncbi:MAG: glycosyltransferase [Balneola sp.]|nr:glycosyltransferase [Balneola sp.]